MKDRENFIEKWTLQRKKGRLKYILTQAGRVAGFGLAGVVVGSLFIYNSPSAYSFSYYLPIYFLVFLSVFVVATLKFIYQWGKNEDKYSQLSNK